MRQCLRAPFASLLAGVLAMVVVGLPAAARAKPTFASPHANPIALSPTLGELYVVNTPGDTLDDGVVARTAAAGHVAVHPWVDTLTEAAVRAAHGAGLAVNTWTCDDADRMRELIAWGVDGICTNVPDVALAVRDGA